MIGAAVMLLVLSLDGRLSWIDAGLLLTVMVVYTVFLVVQSRAQTQGTVDQYAAAMGKRRTGWSSRIVVQLLMIGAGLGLLVLGSNWLVDASVTFARALGVSDVVIGLTIVAAGTSMPEVATSVMAAIKGERDIAVGNVVGSNTFNILGCLGIAGLVSGGEGLVLPASLLNFDLWVMVAAMLACLPVFITGRRIARWEGAVFLLYYVAYVAYLIMASQQHAALGTVSAAMMGFVIPLTVITLVVILLRRAYRH